MLKVRNLKTSVLIISFKNWILATNFQFLKLMKILFEKSGILCECIN